MADVTALRDGEITFLVPLQQNSLGQEYETQSLDEGQYDLMQFTGLCDKNGRKIYEGDVVQWRAEYDRRFLRMKQDVRFVDGVFGIPTTLGQVNLSFYQNKELEVIGNIYENPDLLK